MKNISSKVLFLPNQLTDNAGMIPKSEIVVKFEGEIFTLGIATLKNFQHLYLHLGLLVKARIVIE